MSWTLAGFVAALTALSAGCAGPPQAEWQGRGPFTRPREEILKAMADVLAQKGLTIETRDDARGVLLTKWRVALRPAAQEGHRDRVEMRLDGAPGEWIVWIRAPREINDNAAKPLSEADAQWAPDGGDDEFAAELAYRVALKVDRLRLDE